MINKSNYIAQETLYKYFRPYGLIRDISLLPASSKDLPRYAMIQYSKMRSATSAKNCTHGIAVNGTRLNIVYDMPLVRILWNHILYFA